MKRKNPRRGPSGSESRKVHGAKTHPSKTPSSKAHPRMRSSVPSKGSVRAKAHVRSERPRPESAARGRWVVGIHSCEEVLKVRPHAVAEVLFRSNWEDSSAHREMAKILGALEVPIHVRSLEHLNQIGSGHQGVALRVTEDPVLDWDSLKEPGNHIILVLDGIEDPHNLGSMLRTAWLTGVSGILIPEDRAVGLKPSVCKVASGGAEHVPVEAHTNFGPALSRLKEFGFWVFGLSENGKNRPWDLKLPEKVVWVIGSEGGGMRITTERLCDELVRLPQVSTGSSYNASIAAAMALAETCRQYGKPE